MVCVSSTGSMLRNACGRITSFMFWPYVMPMAWPANTCPRGIDWMPARMISLKYAASKAMKVMKAEYSAPIGRPMMKGTSRKNHRITITSGMLRMPLT